MCIAAADENRGPTWVRVLAPAACMLAGNPEVLLCILEPDVSKLIACVWLCIRDKMHIHICMAYVEESVDIDLSSVVYAWLQMCIPVLPRLVDGALLAAQGCRSSSAKGPVCSCYIALCMTPCLSAGIHQTAESAEYAVINQYSTMDG